MKKTVSREVNDLPLKREVVDFRSNLKKPV